MQLKLWQKKQETESIKTFIFENTEKVLWKAGQYMRYRIPNEQADQKGVMRYFTNAAAPFEEYIQISTRFSDPVSTFKQDLDKLEIGAEITVQGPLGDFTLEDPIEEYVFIAGGIGITPFRSILMQLDHEQKPFTITLLYGNRTEVIAFKEVFEVIATKNPSFNVVYAVGAQLIDEPFITQSVPNFALRTFYLSGPEPMVKGVEGTLAKMGVQAEKIKTDYFPGYDAI